MQTPWLFGVTVLPDRDDWRQRNPSRRATFAVLVPAHTPADLSGPESPVQATGCGADLIVLGVRGRCD
jgi:hypothetical protein